MTKRHQVYKCNMFGNIVEVLHEGAGTLVCCAQDMVLFEEKKEEEGNEKHLPVVKVEGNKVIVEEINKKYSCIPLSEEKKSSFFLKKYYNENTDFIIHLPIENWLFYPSQDKKARDPSSQYLSRYL